MCVCVWNCVDWPSAGETWLSLSLIFFFLLQQHERKCCPNNLRYLCIACKVRCAQWSYNIIHVYENPMLHGPSRPTLSHPRENPRLHGPSRHLTLLESSLILCSCGPELSLVTPCVYLTLHKEIGDRLDNIFAHPVLVSARARAEHVDSLSYIQPKEIGDRLCENPRFHRLFMQLSRNIAQMVSSLLGQGKVST